MKIQREGRNGWFVNLAINSRLYSNVIGKSREPQPDK